MKLAKLALAAAVSFAAALALPQAALAQPAVYSVSAKTGNAGVTFLTDPTGALLTNVQEQYTVATDGYVSAYKEDNGVTGAGVIDYTQLPAEYRAPMSAEDIRTYAPAQTDVQVHATCSGVAALESGPTILAWQGSTPYYAYIPWQAKSAGLGDQPSTWISVVKSATGVDLGTATDLPAACAGLGGTYHPADTGSAVAGSLIADAVAPVQAKVTTLEAQVATLTKAKTTAETALAAEKAARREVEGAYQAQYNREVFVTLAEPRFRARNGVAVLVTGSLGDPVTVSLAVSKQRARSLGLARRVLSEETTEFDSQGAAIVTLTPGKAARRALRKTRGAVDVDVLAVSGGYEATAAAKLSR